VASRHGDRAVALSLQLVHAHHELRRRLDEIRDGLGGRPLPDDALTTHCLAFCTALTTHHRGEDDGLFTQLVRERPDLAGTVAKLVEDHGLIASLLARVRQLAGTAAGVDAPPREAIERELDGLAAIMESHFRYEERVLGAALDTTAPDTGWADAVLRFGGA
jgi:hypothetical protein